MIHEKYCMICKEENTYYDEKLIVQKEKTVEVVDILKKIE